jgi:hypothetical protein
VCVQYDTRLKLEGISSDLQTHLGVSDEENVVFARLDYSRYVDGVRFANGKQISLQVLGPGVRITLVQPEQRSVTVGDESACELA